MVSENFQVGEHIRNGRLMHFNSTGIEALALGTLPDIALCISSSGCSAVSFVKYPNKLVNLSVSLSSELP